MAIATHSNTHTILGMLRCAKSSLASFHLYKVNGNDLEVNEDV